MSYSPASDTFTFAWVSGPYLLHYDISQCSALLLRLRGTALVHEHFQGTLVVSIQLLLALSNCWTKDRAYNIFSLVSSLVI